MPSTRKKYYLIALLLWAEGKNHKFLTLVSFKGNNNIYLKIHYFGRTVTIHAEKKFIASVSFQFIIIHEKIYFEITRANVRLH